MAWSLITSLLTLGASLLPSSIGASTTAADAASSSSSDNDSAAQGRRAFEEDLEKLMRTLERIKATLYDAEEREIRDRSVKLWLKELRTVAYAAEDVLSEYRYEVTRVQVEARMIASEASASHKRKQIESIVPIPDGMADRLNRIRNRFDEIAKDREALQLKESDGVRHANNRILQPPTGHLVDEASIFGRDEETMEVIDLLLSEKEKHLSVISITGKGGLGKTTMAQMVYKDARVRRCFDLFGWIYVSEDFNVVRMIKATIESIMGNNTTLSELSPLQLELAKILKEKRILLILDDVWNENQNLWQLFCVALKGAKLVRILVTTRNEKVVKVMLTTTICKLDYLSENSCWQLFQHYAFGSTRYRIPVHFMEMGRGIIRKCNGLPLAVKSIASLLRHETDEESWRDILENDLWDSDLDIFSALQISYDRLPSHLKPCFLLCSMYPKGYEIQKKTLIELWISLGYINSIGAKRSIREVGTEYYEELKERSFIEYSFGPKKCKLHDIIHDLARFNSEKEHCSVDINQVHDTQEVKIPQELHHLYVQCYVRCVNKVLQQNFKGLRTLSLDLYGCRGYSNHQYRINSTEDVDLVLYLSGYYTDCMENTIFNLKTFELLRVLELKGNHLRDIPDFVTRLKHLSHLRITSKHLEYLPECIGFLYNLQTLILDCWYSYFECLPESIGNLANLQYLRIICANFKKLPNSLCLLSNLQRLEIGNEIFEDVPSDLRKLWNLQELIIHLRENTFPDEIGFRSLGVYPELLVAFASSPRLKTLKIFGCCVNFTPHSLKNFLTMRTMVACLRVRSISWLKDMKDLKGELTIEGLENMSNLLDAQHANMSSKCKSETLNIRWHFEDPHSHSESDDSDIGLRILLIKKHDEGNLISEDTSFSLLEYLQPHPHLKNLELQGYPCATLPSWMGDPFSLQAIQKIVLEDCGSLQSISFRNIHTLKYLKVSKCLGIRVMQLEQLPTQLEKLKVLWCDALELITGLQSLKMLAVLVINSCNALKSIAMNNLESINLCDSYDEKTHKGHQNNTSSLKWLEIANCPLLCALPHELVQPRSCDMLVYHCGCPDIEFSEFIQIHPSDYS